MDAGTRGRREGSPFLIGFCFTILRLSVMDRRYGFQMPSVDVVFVLVTVVVTVGALARGEIVLLFD